VTFEGFREEIKTIITDDEHVVIHFTIKGRHTGQWEPLPGTGKAAFGFASVGLASSDFERPDQVVQLGVPPVRIDLVISITGVSWDEAWGGRVTGRYGDIPVFYIGRVQFVANKRATGRTKDVADLEVLRAM